MRPQSNKTPGWDSQIQMWEQQFWEDTKRPGTERLLAEEEMKLMLVMEQAISRLLRP